MEIVLNEQIKELGVSESQVLCMLKAVGEHRRERYEPTYDQFKDLLTRAVDLERKKNRLALMWEIAFSRVS